MSVNGTDLIYDRTQTDLDNNTEKAFISYVDLNRVETYCEYFSNQFGLGLTTKTWAINDVRDETNMIRLCNNLKSIETYWLGSTSLTQSSIAYQSISEANQVEKLLYDMYESFKQTAQIRPKLGVSAMLGVRSII